MHNTMALNMYLEGAFQKTEIPYIIYTCDFIAKYFYFPSQNDSWLLISTYDLQEQL